MFGCKNIVPARDLLMDASSRRIAVGAFNFTNIETLKAIVIAAKGLNSPVILQASESAIQYIGLKVLVAIVSEYALDSDLNLALHLDHGKDFETCKMCVDAGFSSVMIDKSSLNFEDNIKETKRVVEYARDRGVSVEAELGTLAGIEDDVNISEKDALYTDPSMAAEFVEKTGVDSLAVAIGTSHGPNKGKTKSPVLDIERLAEIKRMVGNLPLVLHGASSVYQDIVDGCNQYGADIRGAFGIQDEDIKMSIRNGIAKINVDTDIRLAFLFGIRKYMHDNKGSIDMRKYLAAGVDAAKDIVSRKIRLFSLGI